MSERRSPQDDSAWIEWSGGNQPVDDEVLLEVVLKNGMQYEEYSDEIRWSSRNDCDVARYRVVGAAA